MRSSSILLDKKRNTSPVPLGIWQTFFRKVMSECSDVEFMEHALQLHIDIHSRKNEAGVDDFSDWISAALEDLCYTPQQKFELFLAFQKRYHQAEVIDRNSDFKETLENTALKNGCWQLILMPYSVSIFEAYESLVPSAYKAVVDELIAQAVFDRQLYLEVNRPSEFQAFLQLLVDLRRDVNNERHCYLTKLIAVTILARQTNIFWQADIFHWLQNSETAFINDYLYPYVKCDWIAQKYMTLLFRFNRECEGNWQGVKKNLIQQYCFRSLLYCLQTATIKDSVEREKKINLYLFQQAKVHFQHDVSGRIWRLLADVVFVPLGILTFGRIFRMKKECTGAYTFSGEDPARVRLLTKRLKVDDQSEMVSLECPEPLGCIRR